MTIERVKVRATVVIGGLSVSTPLIPSFNVRKQRGQVSTFDASLKVESDSISGGITGGNIEIYAGTDSGVEIIFTGICRAAKISPCYDDPKYVILSISGADAMSLLQGKKYTRRCRATQSTWVAITSVTREGLKSGKFAYQNEPTIEITTGLQEKADSLTVYSGTPSSERNTSESPADRNDLSPPQLSVVLDNTGGE